MDDAHASFTPNQMYELCGGNPEECTFDFSVIPFDDYHLFFELSLALATVAGREDEGGVL